MNMEQINWMELKRTNYLEWGEELRRRTLELLTVHDDTYLAQFNQCGYFHRVRDRGHFEQMRKDWERFGRVPEEWIYKGKWPGIWAAMFDPHNTYSHSGDLFLYVARFSFKDGFRIYKVANPKHRNQWETWDAKDRPNPWEHTLNERRQSLKQRMENDLCSPLPSHKKFFEDHKFGVVMGYSDYVSPIITLEDSVENVEFLDLGVRSE